MTRILTWLAVVPAATLVLGTFPLSLPAHAQGGCGSSAVPFTGTANGSTTYYYDPYDWWGTSADGNTLVEFETSSESAYMAVYDSSCTNELCTVDSSGECLARDYSGPLYIYVHNWVESMTYTITTTALASLPTECEDGLDNDLNGSTDYPADPGCTSANDKDESSPAPPAACNVVNTAGVCVDITTGDVIAGHTVYDVVTTPAATHTVAGYLDAYRFALPTGGSVVVPCVTLVVSAVSASPCAVAGGTFVERSATLVQRSVGQPGIGTDAPLLTVRVCAATVTITVGGYGVEDFPAVAVC